MATEPTKPVVTSTSPAVKPQTSEVKPAAPVTPAFVFNKELLEKRIEEIKKFQYKFSGKPGYNPYLWISRNVGPLERRLRGIVDSTGRILPEQTKELHDLIMHLPVDTVPKTPESPTT